MFRGYVKTHISQEEYEAINELVKEVEEYCNSFVLESVEVGFWVFKHTEYKYIQKGTYKGKKPLLAYLKHSPHFGSYPSSTEVCIVLNSICQLYYADPKGELYLDNTQAGVLNNFRLGKYNNE